jgi:hypothetical protein
MADPPITQAISIDISDEGLAATHPLDIVFPHPVAPAFAGSKEHNSLRDFLPVVGCAMFPDVTFQFDSSLVGPEVRKATRRLARFREQLKQGEGLKDGEDPAFPPIALFGHADPIGEPEYNSKLSARRALCIYGMLLHKVEIWEDLFKDKDAPKGDVWGDEEFNTMLDEVGFEPELPKGSEDEAARKAILARLKKNGADRARLFAAYMDAVCVQEAATGDVPFVLKEADFLDRGAGADHKGAVQGCGEFNPVLILSKAKQDRFAREKDKLGRDAANEPNRRVLAFLFKPGTRIVPKKWPCPSVKDKHPEKACRTRLWKDASRRLAPDPKTNEKEARDRAFKDSGDTMGCRFYHAFAQNSPCEGTLKLWVLRIGFDDELKADGQGQVIEDDKGRNQLNHPLARKRYVVRLGKDAAAPIVRGRTDERGGLRLPVFDEQLTMSLKVDAKSLLASNEADNKKAEDAVPETEFFELVVRAGDLVPLVPPDDDLENGLGVRQRLSNVGYGPPAPVAAWKAEDTKQALAAFQRKHGLAETAEPDTATLTQLRKVHGS